MTISLTPCKVKQLVEKQLRIISVDITKYELRHRLKQIVQMIDDLNGLYPSGVRAEVTISLSHEEFEYLIKNEI